MQKKNLLNLLIVGGLLVAFSLPFLFRAAIGLSDRSTAVEMGKLRSKEESFETSGDYQIKEDQVVFDFELINRYSEAKELRFGSGQQFEIVIRNEKDEEVYRYSEGKAFTLALVYRNIDPGASLTWQDQWDMRDQEGKLVSPGRYRAEIEIMPIPDEDEENIEASQLRTNIDFTLAGTGAFDFLNAEEIGYNQVLSSGNMLENQFEIYSNPIIVEYYFSGFNPDYMGMDWRSLRLVFEQDGADWKLTGVIHNQWTV